MLEVNANVKNLAWQNFLQRGWPKRSEEAWKYTSLKPLADLNLKSAAKGTAIPESTLAFVRPRLSAGHDSLVFIDGVFVESLSAGKIAGATLRHLTNQDIQPVQVASFDDRVERLNFVHSNELFEIVIQAGQKLAKPLHICNLTTGAQSISSPRVRVHMQAGGEASLIEESADLNLSQGEQIQNSFVRFDLDADSKLKYLRIQNNNLQSYHLGRTEFSVSDRVQLDSLVLNLGSKLARHELLLQLKGTEAQVQCLGGVLGVGDRHVDNFTQIQHFVGGNNAQQLYKGILDDNSKSVFRGLVHIEKDAQKANSDQLNNNLLLSSNAEAVSLPQLQIYADDVKATHGSTVGELDNDEIFYFQSRAISKDQAVQLLSAGFLNEVIFRMNDELLQNYALFQVQSALQSQKAKK